MVRKKGILRVLIVYLLVITQFGCEKDLYQIDSQNIIRNNNLKTYPITGEKAKLQAEKLRKKLNLYTKGKQLKTNNGLIVDYEKVMVLENEYDQVSYSFKVNTNSETPNSFKNVVMLEKNGKTVIKLVTYQMTPSFAEQYRADTKNLAQFDGTISIINLDSYEDCCDEGPSVINISDGSSGGSWGIGYSGGSSSGGGISIGTSNIPSAFCASGQHFKGDPSCAYEQTSGPAVSNRMANNPNTNGAIGGVISNTNSNNLDLCCITDFVIFNEIMFERDCEKLKDQMNPAKQNIKPKLNWLKNLVINENEIEYASDFLRQTVFNPNGEDTYSYSNTQIIGGDGYVNIPGNNLSVGAAHCHTEKGYSIFSFADLEVLLTMHENSSESRRDDQVYMLVCKNHNDTDNPLVYAIKVNEYLKLKAGFDSVWDNPKYQVPTTNNPAKDKDTKMKKIHKLLRQQYDDNKDNLEKFFLEKFADFGISLYKADDSLNNWNKLELANGSAGTSIVASKPCQ